MALQKESFIQYLRKGESDAVIPLLKLQQARHCTRSILDAVQEKAMCYGGIFLDNVLYHPVCNQDDTQVDLYVMVSLDGPKNTTQLWARWISEQSSNIAYIPPEEILGIGDQSKVDSWDMGCLVIQLLNFGKPLELMRHRRHGSVNERFEIKGPEIIDRLRQFYTGIGKEQDLVVGPEIALDKVPYALEDFLAHCLDAIPAQRWTLSQLRKHPFVDLAISPEELFAMDEAYYSTLPIVNSFIVNNIRLHPYLANSTTYSILVGDSPNVNKNRPNGTPVEIWKFQLLDEARDRDLYTRAYGRLLDLLTMEGSNDEAVRERAGFYRIRALQQGHQNIVHHYGCQFTPRPNTYSAPEFLVFTEHCAGGNFHQASEFSLPLKVIEKWVQKVLHGLDFLHKHGIVHRNINSSIIFFTDPVFKGTVKIGGFHNMRQLAGDHTQRHEISARRGQDGRFAAPEISNAAYDISVGRKCDMWSFGCVVLHLVTGHPPLYKGLSGRIIDSEMAVIYYLNHHKSGPEIPDWVPDSVRAFIGRCLQFDPGHRPTPAQLLQDQSGLKVDEASPTEYHTNRSGIPLLQDVTAYWTQDNGRV